MNCKSLFIEKTPDHQDGIILSDIELIRYLTGEGIGVKNIDHTAIVGWIRNFFIRGNTVIRYNLFPTFYYETQQKWGSWRDTDKYIGDLMLACDSLYHMYIRHPEMRNDKFQEKAARLGEVTLESIKTQDSSGFQILFKEICSETKLVPEQLAIFFTEKKLAVIKPPLPRFFSLTSQELFDCLRDGLPDDVDANSSTEKKQELVSELKDIIKGRNLQFRDKMMEMLEVFSNSIQYQGIKYEKEQITVTYVNENKIKPRKKIKHNQHYIKYDNGIIHDTMRGQEWFVGPDQDIDWFNAKSWIDLLVIEGGGWRMPTNSEVQALHDIKTGFFETTGRFVWTSDTGAVKENKGDLRVYAVREYCPRK